jgi:hypothetical protein
MVTFITIRQLATSPPFTHQAIGNSRRRNNIHHHPHRHKLQRYKQWINITAYVQICLVLIELYNPLA